MPKFFMSSGLPFVIATALLASAFSLQAHGAQTAPIPDLSGYWGREMLNLEAPPSGPAPITNTARRPDGTINDIAVRLGDFASPMLQPEASQLLRNRAEFSRAGNSIPDPHNQCWPEPPPFTLAIELGMQLLQKRDEVLLIYLYNNNVRRVRLNQPHPMPLTPSWLGDSVGHYEGDTLVIDTVGIKAGPLAVIDRYGTPFSERMHVIERYRRIDAASAREAQEKHRRTIDPPGAPNIFADAYGQGLLDDSPNAKGLQVEVTVDDPGIFNRIWKGLVTYRNLIGRYPEVVCAENLREANGPDKKPPVDDTPDF
jgi:hypothetical protein